MHLEWLSELRLRFMALLRRRRLDQDLNDELQFHLAERAERHRREGIETAQADRLARREFGNVTALKETSRDMWTFRWMEALSQDLRYTLRSLSKSPVFTLVVILTLALGIGSTAAIFSVFDAVVLRPLPYHEPSELVLLIGNVQRETVERRGTSFPDYFDWRDESESFEGMALYFGDDAALQGADDPVRVTGEFVAQPYFDLLGVSPALGRVFLPSEDEVVRRDAVVVLGGGLWQRQFGGDPEIVGRVVRLNDTSYTVVGVMPEWFRGITDEAEFWLPLHMVEAEMFEYRGNRGPNVLGRLKSNVSLEQAQAEMEEICRRLERQYPDTNEGRGVELAPLDQELFGDIRQPLAVLLGAVGLVLLIACTNVANLLLVRSETRQREVALRTALGAGRARVFGQLTVESCVLAALGAGAGLLLAYWGVGVLASASPVTLPSYIQPAVDLRVALFAAGLTGLVGLLLGLAPAFHLRSVQLQEVFKQASRGSTSGLQGRGFRNALVVAEVALAMLLLVGSGLFMRSLQQLTQIRPGYEPAQLLTLRVALLPQPAGNGESQVLQMVRAASEIPGVESVAAASDTPLAGGGAVFYSAEGQPPVTAQDRPRAYIHRVTPSFFDALQTPFIAGRAFNESELEGPPQVVIVSENVVKRFWPGEDGIGKRIRIGDSPWVNIVGVVNEMKYRGLPENPTADPDLFFPFNLNSSAFAVLARTSVEPSAAAPAIREALSRSGPPLITYNIDNMERLVANQTVQQQFTSWLMGVFACAALLLATIGIYGVLSYAVTRRLQEFSIRMALGAQRGDVLRLVTGSGLGLVGIGLIVGAGCALLMARSVETLLYGILPSDPITFAAAGAVLACVALLASLIPAFRAVRLAPAAALREE